MPSASFFILPLERLRNGRKKAGKILRKRKTSKKKRPPPPSLSPPYHCLSEEARNKSRRGKDDKGGKLEEGEKVVMFLFCPSFPRKPRRKRIKKAW